MSSFISSAERQLGTATSDFSEYVVDRLELFIVNVASIAEHFHSQETDVIGEWYSAHLDELVACLRSVLRQWLDCLNYSHVRTTVSYNASLVHAFGRGRPRFDISREQLLYLRSLSFTWKQIAEILGVSHMTIYRRREQCGLIEEPSGTLSDSDLQELITHMRGELSNLGQTMVWGRLRSLGFKVTRSRVREAIRNTDPMHTALRWREVTSRRCYSVPGPNSLWHLGRYIAPWVRYVWDFI